ncbi:MAG: ABC transporter substrate-binding protein [Acidimicrobiales bacterium]|nr:ABC transporter substrate-binding protein [Acidimicrobiales bacterium]MBO0892863.1 ABC transporter substrate-binding protein [Acidimicrobiales bacterium]
MAVRRQLRWVAAVVASLLATLGVAGSAASASGGTVAKAASHQKSLTVLEWQAGFGTWPNLDPATVPVAGSESWYFDAIDGQLFDQGLHGALLPDLATGYQFTNAKTFTIDLRHGVTFSDGTPFNAQAVAFNIKRDLDPANACTCIANFPVASITTPDNYTVVLNLSHAYAHLKYSFFGEPPNWPISPTALGKLGEKAFSVSPVGAGPFEVVSNQSTKLVLKRNPHYWEKGHPFLQTLTFQSVGNDQSAYDALQAGQAQAYQDYSTFNTVKTVKQHYRVTAINTVQDSPYEIQLNTLRPPFNNLLAREAIYYATNPGPIDKTVAANYGLPAESPTGPTSLYHQTKVPGYRTYNLAKAKALVKQLGGLSVDLGTIAAPDTEEMIEALQSEWKQAGITTHLAFEPFPSWEETFRSHNWQAELSASGGFDPALSALSFSFSSTSPNSGVNDPTLNNLIAEGAATVSSAAQTKLYQQIWKYISDKAYMVFLFGLPYFNVTEKSVTGPGLSTDGFQVTWQDVKVK